MELFLPLEFNIFLIEKKKRLFRALKTRGTVFSLFEKVYEVFGQNLPLYFFEKVYEVFGQNLLFTFLLGSHGRVICAGGDWYYLHLGIEYIYQSPIFHMH